MGERRWSVTWEESESESSSGLGRCTVGVCGGGEDGCMLCVVRPRGDNAAIRGLLYG
jgi:hypothetical protein